MSKTFKLIRKGVLAGQGKLDSTGAKKSCLREESGANKMREL